MRVFDYLKIEKKRKYDKKNNKIYSILRMKA